MTEHIPTSDSNNVAEIEEGVIEEADPAEPTSSTQASPRKAGTRLSIVSQKYDINGDGVLDPAELASKLYHSRRLPPCETSLCRVPRRHFSHM